MKPVVKGLLIGFIVVLVIVTGFFAYMFFPIGMRDGTVPTSKITSDISVLKGGFVNAYVINTGDYYIMIDALESVKSLGAALSNLGIRPAEVEYVFLTHSDGDHIGGLGILSNADVFMSPDEKQMIDGTHARFFFMPPKIIKGAAFTMFTNNETIELGNKTISAIATPGHTPGSQSYLVDGKYLFAGDAFNLNNNKVEEFFFKYTMNIPQHIQSIKKLAALTGIEEIFTAHTGYTTNTTGVFDSFK